MDAIAQKFMTQAEFLEWEAKQPERYEYDRGVIRAMTGGTMAHDQIRGAIIAGLRNEMRGKPCRTYIDIRVVCPSGNVRYPDAAVDCGPYNPKGLNLTDPKLVVEVLSPSTQATDYLVKSEDYGSFASITSYWIVWTDEPRIDVLNRVDGELKLTSIVEGLDKEIEEVGLGLKLKLSDIFG
jgi:Uma2 family endonuclease